MSTEIAADEMPPSTPQMLLMKIRRDNQDNSSIKDILNDIIGDQDPTDAQRKIEEIANQIEEMGDFCGEVAFHLVDIVKERKIWDSHGLSQDEYLTDLGMTGTLGTLHNSYQNSQKHIHLAWEHCTTAWGSDWKTLFGTLLLNVKSQKIWEALARLSKNCADLEKAVESVRDSRTRRLELNISGTRTGPSVTYKDVAQAACALKQTLSTPTGK